MPLMNHCPTPHCPGYTEPGRKMCADCQARLEACPNCGGNNASFDLRDRVKVDGEDYVVDHTGHIGKRVIATEGRRSRWLRVVPVVYIAARRLRAGESE